MKHSQSIRSRIVGVNIPRGERIATALGTTPQALFGGPAAAAEPTLARSADDAVPTIDTDGESLRRLLLPGDAPFHVIELRGRSEDAGKLPGIKPYVP